MTFLLRLFCAQMILCGVASAADLRGHGGPVRGIAVAPGADLAATVSFDSTVILWSLGRSAALQVLRFHEGPLNAVVLLPDGRIATGGEDARIALWRLGGALPEAVLVGHSGPVSALGVSPDGAHLVSASWDGTARLWPLAGGAPVVLSGHQGPVNGAAFRAPGEVVTAGYDGTLRYHDMSGALLNSVTLGAPLNALRVSADGMLIVAAADGKLRFVASSGARREVDISEAPLVALAVSPDGALVAAAGFRGALALVDRASGGIIRKMEGPAFPLWSLAFSADGREILTGGADRLVRRWNIETGEPQSPVMTEADGDIPARLKSHPGADVFKACIACHTLTSGGGNRAGPTLAGLYGRKIGAAPGYDYSPALRLLPIIWSAETVQKLFEIGPAAYTPGTKMPEQKLNSAEDRKALADFLGLITQQ